MNEHQTYSEHIPEYLNRTMAAEEQKAFEVHLQECETCQAEVEEWQLIAGVVQVQIDIVVPSRNLAAAALQQASTDSHSGWNLNYAITMIRAQISLIRSELWASASLILMLGIISAVLFNRAGFFTIIAPLVASACVATIYGKDNDQGHELMLSTPVSQTQILLSRLVLVFGYNLVLFVVGMLLLQPFQESSFTMALLGDWLAPMTFLSSLALLLSVSIGASQAILVTYVFWLTSQFLEASYSLPSFSQLLSPLTGFWNQTSALFGLSLMMLILTLVYIRLPLNGSHRTTT